MLAPAYYADMVILGLGRSPVEHKLCREEGALLIPALLVCTLINLNQR
jgi:hypothetical protein